MMSSQLGLAGSRGAAIITITVPQQVKAIPDISTLARLAAKEGQEKLMTMDLKVKAMVMEPADTGKQKAKEAGSATKLCKTTT